MDLLFLIHSTTINYNSTTFKLIIAYYMYFILFLILLVTQLWKHTIRLIALRPPPPSHSLLMLGRALRARYLSSLFYFYLSLIFFAIWDFPMYSRIFDNPRFFSQISQIQEGMRNLINEHSQKFQKSRRESRKTWKNPKISQSSITQHLLTPNTNSPLPKFFFNLNTKFQI